MDVIPAIDLRNGRCVRLFQGDYNREQVFSDDPVEVALYWEHLGARWLHVVDLDGAASGSPKNLGVISAIKARVKIPLQVGGGIRDLDTASNLLRLGASRIIFGTAAIEAPDLVTTALERLGNEAVVVSVDARDGQVAVRGWKKQSHLKAKVLFQRLAELGVSRIIYTDIAKDGTLSAPDFPALAGLLSYVSCPLLIAGGISSLTHLQQLSDLGVEGAIVGMALYTRSIDLSEALQTIV